MLFAGKALESIGREDLEGLIGDATKPEGRLVDYKSALPGNTRDDKKEFLADICSFANVGGGYIVFGMEEEAGIAKRIDLPPKFVPPLKLDSKPWQGVAAPG